MNKVNSGILANVENGLISSEAMKALSSAKESPDIIQLISTEVYPNNFWEIPYNETIIKNRNDFWINCSKFTFLNIGIASSNKKYKPNCPNDFTFPENKITRENRNTKLSERLEIVLVNTVNIGINTIVLYIVALKAKNLLMKEKLLNCCQ